LYQHEKEEDKEYKEQGIMHVTNVLSTKQIRKENKQGDYLVCRNQKSLEEGEWGAAGKGYERKRR
jgi:hypothetical protein